MDMKHMQCLVVRSAVCTLHGNLPVPFRGSSRTSQRQTLSRVRERDVVYMQHIQHVQEVAFSVLKREFMISISCWSLVNVITPWGDLDIAGCQGISSGLCQLGLCMLPSYTEARSDLLGATGHTGPGSDIHNVIGLLSIFELEFSQLTCKCFLFVLTVVAVKTYSAFHRIHSQIKKRLGLPIACAGLLLCCFNCYQHPLCLLCVCRSAH